MPAKDHLILRNGQAVGDIIMLTAAVRDLKRAHGDRWEVSVRTSCPELWDNNPWLDKPKAYGPRSQVIEMGYGLWRNSNTRPYHFIHGFIQHLESQLRVKIPVTEFKGDLHLARPEIEAMGPVQEKSGYGGRYWAVWAGGKADITCKLWDPQNYQQVVDRFHGRIQFVQLGSHESTGVGRHFNYPLNNVISLVGQTNLREMLRVIYHADGVLCPVTSAMHAAAALPVKPGGPLLKPCVVIAGGRESAHWEAYPGHRFLDSIGRLPCCAAGGCWKARCQPIGDGRPTDQPEHMCVDPVQVSPELRVPRCMKLITVDDVEHAISSYYGNGVLEYADMGSQG